MKYYKRLQVYKASNLEFNPKTLEATSYGWWTFTKVINNQLVFNDFAYSNTTRRHQRKTKQLLADLGYKIDLSIEVPQGLQQFNWSEDAISLLNSRIEELKAAINKKGSKKAKNVERYAEIHKMNQKIKAIKELVA